MTTHPMSVRKFMKINKLFRHDLFENAPKLLEVEEKLSARGYVRVNGRNIRPIAIVDGQMIPYTVALNSMYQWCHKQLGTKNWVKVSDHFWFTNDMYRAMFVMTWLER